MRKSLVDLQAWKTDVGFYFANLHFILLCERVMCAKLNAIFFFMQTRIKHGNCMSLVDELNDGEIRNLQAN